MTSVMPIELINATHVDEDALASAAELMCRVWPKPDRTPESRLAATLRELESYRGRADAGPRFLMIREEGTVIAHASIIPREISVAGRRIVIAALARVCTAPEIRGRGLGELVVRAALESVDQGEFPLALFQTTEEVRPFYERLGAVVVTNRIVNSLGDNPDACPFWSGVAMRYPGGAAWPEGTVDLLGPGY